MRKLILFSLSKQTFQKPTRRDDIFSFLSTRILLNQRVRILIDNVFLPGNTVFLIYT